MYNEGDVPDTLKPREEHSWTPYEPHTTSNKDQFTGLYHTTGELIPQIVKKTYNDGEDAGENQEEENADKVDGVNEVDPNDVKGRANMETMSGYDKSAEDLASRPLTKGERAHARRMAADPDMQPELKTLPPVYGSLAKIANAEPLYG